MNGRATTAEYLLPRSARALLCLLLAVTFLYNPFFVVSSSSTVTSVCHLPSFRADLASSELLKFKSDVQIAVLFVVDRHFPDFVAPAIPLDCKQFNIRPADEPVSPQVLSVANIWFRPPPVV